MKDDELDDMKMMRKLHGENQRLTAELEKVKAENEQLKGEARHARNMEAVAIGHRTSDAIIKNCDIRELKAVVRDLAGALEFYGDRVMWYMKNVDGCADSIQPGDREEIGTLKLGGKRAREVLSKHADLISKVKGEGNG